VETTYSGHCSRQPPLYHGHYCLAQLYQSCTKQSALSSHMSIVATNTGPTGDLSIVATNTGPTGDLSIVATNTGPTGDHDGQALHCTTESLL